MSTKINQIVQNFHTSLIHFLDELIEQFPMEDDIVLARLFLKNSIPPVTIINTFIKETLPLKECITNRDEDKFLNSDLSIFNSLNKNKVNHFKVLWKSSVLDDEDRQVIWRWFDTFIYLAEQYQKLKIEN